MTALKSHVFITTSSDRDCLTCTLNEIDNDGYAIVAVTHVAEERRFYIFCQKADDSVIDCGDSVHRVSKSY